MSQRSSSVDRGKRSFIPQATAMPGRRRSGSMDNINVARRTQLPSHIARPSVAPSSAAHRGGPKAGRPTMGFTTPSRSTTKAQQPRYTLSAVRSSGGSAFGAGAARPAVNDPDYVSSACERIEHYLSKLYMSYQLPRDFRSCPSRNSFGEVFLQLAGQLDSSVKPDVRMSDEDVLKFMKNLGFTQTVPKSSLMVIQKRTWPNVLAMLDFLVDLLSVLDIVTDECEAVAFPLCGDPASDPNSAYQMMIFNDIMMPEYVNFMNAPVNAQELDTREEQERLIKRTTEALELFHNIENADPEELKQECLALEADLTKQREVTAALNAEYQELVAKLSEEHATQGQLNEKLEALKLKDEDIATRNAEYEAKAAELEKQTAAIQAQNDALNVKIAAQPLSHEAATQLRSELRDLREKQRGIAKGMTSVMQLIEEKKAELTPLLAEFGEHARVFHDAVLRLFGSKGLTEFGAKSTIITDENVVQWVQTVGAKLNEAAKAKTADIEVLKASLAKTDAEMVALNKRKAELEAKVKASRDTYDKASSTRTAELEKLAKVVQDAKMDRKAVDERIREGEKKLVELKAELKRAKNELLHLRSANEDAAYCLAVVEKTAEDAKKGLAEGLQQALNDVRDQRKKCVDQMVADLKEYAEKNVDMDKRLFDQIKENALEVQDDIKGGLERIAEMVKAAYEVMGAPK